MSTGMATDEVLNMVTQIENRRQEMARVSNVAVACEEAMRKLHELLEHERMGLQLHSSSTTHPVNIEVVASEISRIKLLGGAGTKLAPKATGRRGRR